MRSVASPLVVLVMILSLASVSLGEDPVYFADPNLKAAVEMRLGVSNPTPTDMLALTLLAQRFTGIGDLTGLEYATNLTTLALQCGQISDIGVLAGLTKLTSLTLYGHQLSDIAVLAGLTNLTELDLSANQISDISALAGLHSLQDLWLVNNQISDISVLSGLTNLRGVTLGSWGGDYIGGNQVSDISALGGLTNLDYVNLSNNPLNGEAYTVYIPQILANNPDTWLYYDPYSATSVYRFWSAVYGHHFYTVNERERDKLINRYSDVWTYEGGVYSSFADEYDTDMVPVYRFWSDSLGSHFYTINEAERDKLINRYSDVWAYEGVVFWAYPEGAQPEGAKPVYRFWSDSLGGHFYTISESEKDKLINRFSDVWTYEGIAWYAYDE
jgi:hypothetical protein